MKNINIKSNKQMALEYVVYMIMTSYFKKSECDNSLFENKLFLNYKEQKEKEQIRMEDVAIKYMEEQVLPKLPKDAGDQSVFVLFRRYTEEVLDKESEQRYEIPKTEIQLVGENITLRFTCGWDGNRPTFASNLDKKEERAKVVKKQKKNKIRCEIYNLGNSRKYYAS